MLRWLLFSFALLVAGAGHCAVARVGAMDIRKGHAGIPCFTITEAEEARSGAPQFLSIAVRAAGSGRKLPPAWTMVMPGSRTFPVTFRMCIPYAGRLPVLPQTPAAELRAGRAYEVDIAVRAPASKTAPRIYRGWFCLAPGGHGVPALRTLDAAQARARGGRGCVG